MSFVEFCEVFFEVHAQLSFVFNQKSKWYYTPYLSQIVEQNAKFTIRAFQFSRKSTVPLIPLELHLNLARFLVCSLVNNERNLIYEFNIII